MRILVIGCGRVGSRLAAALARRGDAVTVIDPDDAALARLGPHVRAARVHGDAGDEEVLLDAGIREVDGFAAVTGSDELNAVLGRLAATTFDVPRVVARIYDPAKAEIYRRLGVQTIAPTIWGARRLAELLTLSELTPVANLGTGEVEVVDVRLPALLAGRAVTELTIPGDTQVVAITRDGHTTLSPERSALLQAGDIVHVAVASMARLQAVLGVH
jgi:trk system potassium uptake protein